MTSRHSSTTAHARTVSRATLVFRELRGSGPSRGSRGGTSLPAEPEALPPCRRRVARSMRDGDSRLFHPLVNDLPKNLVAYVLGDPKGLPELGLRRRRFSSKALPGALSGPFSGSGRSPSLALSPVGPGGPPHGPRPLAPPRPPGPECHRRRKPMGSMDLRRRCAALGWLDQGWTSTSAFSGRIS